MPDDKVAHSLTEFIELLKKTTTNLDDSKTVIAYIGHADKDYKMLPSLFRESNAEIRKKEATLLHEIEAEYPSEFLGMKTLDKLAKLQHYGFPTRLFDVTLIPLVALYFAVEANNESENKSDGAVIIAVCRKD